MKIVETYVIIALDAFACYAAYGETEGLTDDEARAFDHYVYDGLNIPAGGHAVIDIGDEEAEFARCEVTNMRGNCIEYRINILAPE